MESEKRAPRFTYSSFDKFTDKTTIKWKDPLLGKVWGAKWDMYIYELSYSVGGTSFRATFDLTLRMVKINGVESLVFDYKYRSSDWIFLKNGNLIVHIPGGENIVLQPHESNTDVRDGGKITEVGYYQISKEDLKTIADGENLSVRVSGDSKAFELEEKGLLKFQFMARSFYADVYEDSTYDAWIDSVVGSRSSGTAASGEGGGINAAYWILAILFPPGAALYSNIKLSSKVGWLAFFVILAGTSLGYWPGILAALIYGARANKS